ncbi:hypothetical protein V8C43DRAFT_288028 [Trichoderma afarasin]
MYYADIIYYLLLYLYLHATCLEMALQWKGLVGRRRQDGAGLEVFHQFGASLVSTPDVGRYPALEQFKIAARCRNLINPTPEKLEARFKRLSEEYNKNCYSHKYQPNCYVPLYHGTNRTKE